MSTFTALIHREDDLYVAECPEVGTVSQGVTIESAVITAFEVLAHDGEDPAYYAQAEALTETVLQKQSTDVDTISGATFSSRGILEALNDAVDKAVNG